MMIARRILLALGLLAPFVMERAVLVETDPAPRTAAVSIKDFAFVPAVLNVSVGETVTWTNQDDDPHAVVANDKTFRTRALDTGEVGSIVFSQPGEYGYYCSLHPHMTAKIIVTAP